MSDLYERIFKGVEKQQEAEKTEKLQAEFTIAHQAQIYAFAYFKRASEKVWQAQHKLEERGQGKSDEGKI